MNPPDAARTGAAFRPPPDGRSLRGLVGLGRRGAEFPAAWSSAGIHDVPCLFTVRCAGAVWRLEGEGLEPVVFAQGGDAERQGRRVARGLAWLGRDAKVNVYDAQGRLAGAINFYARTSPAQRRTDRAFSEADKGAPH